MIQKWVSRWEEGRDGKICVEQGCSDHQTISLIVNRYIFQVECIPPAEAYGPYLGTKLGFFTERTRDFVDEPVLNRWELDN
jgi:hypothetical protein